MAESGTYSRGSMTLTSRNTAPLWPTTTRNALPLLQVPALVVHLGVSSARLNTNEVFPTQAGVRHQTLLKSKHHIRGRALPDSLLLLDDSIRTITDSMLDRSAQLCVY